MSVAPFLTILSYIGSHHMKYNNIYNTITIVNYDVYESLKRNLGIKNP